MHSATAPVRLWPIAVLTAAVAVGVGGTVLAALYQVGIEQQKLRLANIAQSRARIIEAVARFDALHSPGYPGGPLEATLSQLREAHDRLPGFGETGEFVLARREGAQIDILMRHRRGTVDDPGFIPFDTTIAEPIRRALAGESGTVIGLDYRGERVVAAYEPVRFVDMVTVAKINLAEVRAPFVTAGFFGALGAAALIALGLLALRYLGRPIMQRIELSEARYRSLVAAAPNGVFVAKGTTIEECNDAALLMFGATSSADIVGKHPWDLSPPVQPDGRHSEGAVRDRLQQLAVGHPVRFPWTHQRLDGRPFETEVSVAVVPIGGEHRLLAVVRDATASTRAERALRESEELFRQAAEHNPAAFAIFDSEERFVYANQRALELAGVVDADALIGRRSEDVLPRELADVYTPFLQQAITERRVVSTESSVHIDDQRLDFALTAVPLMDEAGDVHRVLAITFNLTDVKRQESQLVRFARAIEQAGEMVIVTDREGAIEWVNPAFESISGYTREEAVGQNPRMLKSGSHPDAFYRDVWATLDAGEPWRGRFVNRRKDGELFVLDQQITPVRDAGGAISFYVSVGRDATRETQLEEQLRQSQKLEAIGQLTSGIAHDFNNLLTVILANAEMLAGGTAVDDAELEELGTEIQEAAVRGRDVVRQLVGFARQAALTVEPLDLAEVVREAGRLLARVLPETIEVKHTTKGTPITVVADRGAIEQMLLNLATNARDAMPDGGVLAITVDAARLSVADVAIHPWVSPGNYGRLSVADSGVGISAEHRAKLFEPFFTTKPRGQGSGLGLAMVYGLVKQLRGFIHVYSDVGIGTTFRIYLPLAPADAVPVHRKPTTAEAKRGSETILVAEDEPALRRVAQRVLETAGYRVLSARNGREALKVIEHHPEVALIISDFVMPHMGGAELLSALRARRYGGRFLLTSGHSDRASQEHRARDVAFVAKPWTVDEFLAAVRRALARPPLEASPPRGTR